MWVGGDADAGRALTEANDAFIFDMDGVLWIGDRAIGGSAGCVRQLMDMGKTVLFMTNNSTLHRSAYLKKFEELGFKNIQPDQIFTSGYATALYLKGLKDQGKFNGKIFAAAGDGLVQELSEVGIESVGGFSHARQRANAEVEACASLVPDSQIRGVVTGWSHVMNYWTITYATLVLQDPSALFLATNDDRLTPQGKRKTLIPGGGFVMAAISWASSREAQVVGKPSQFMLDVIFRRSPSLHRRRTLMIGDRLDTDIAFGNRGGLQTLLVLSGTTNVEQMDSHEEKPDYVAESIACLAGSSSTPSRL